MYFILREMLEDVVEIVFSSGVEDFGITTVIAGGFVAEVGLPRAIPEWLWDSCSVAEFRVFWIVKI